GLDEAAVVEVDRGNRRVAAVDQQYLRMQKHVIILELVHSDAIRIFLDEEFVELGDEPAAEIALEVDASDQRYVDAARQRPVEGMREPFRQVEMGVDDLDRVPGGVDQVDVIILQRAAGGVRKRDEMAGGRSPRPTG